MVECTNGRRWGAVTGLIAFAFCSLVPSTWALESVTVGQDGDLTWLSAGAAVVSSIPAEYLAPPDPNNPGGTPSFITGNAPGNLVEFDSSDFPGSIAPLRVPDCPEGTCLEANVASNTVDRGGSIRLPTFSDFSLQYKRPDLDTDLLEIISSKPGGEEDAIEFKLQNAFGQLLILDMGSRFPVNRIRFYPRNAVQKSPGTPFQSDFLRAFESFTNDGEDVSRSGVQIWDPLLTERDNRKPVVDIPVDPPRYVRSVRLKSLTQFDFEIDEIEVYGNGFLPRAVFLSDIYDAGQAANWVQLRWVEEVLGDPQNSGMQIRTRTGSDDSPFVLTRRLRGLPAAEEIPFSLDDPTRHMTRQEYEKLPDFDDQGREWEPGSAQDDLVNWSPFSTPFPAEDGNGPGSPIVSPNPRRYFQFQVLFESEELEAARILRSVSFDLLSPPLADDVVGEIYPREVAPSTSTTFVYAVRPRMRTPGLIGFDTIEISTPARVESIDQLELWDRSGQLVASRQFSSLDDRTEVDGFRIVSVEDDRFSVSFPKVTQDSTQVRVQFRTSVLNYSTSFAAAAVDGSDPTARQAITSGDAADLAAEDNPDLSGTTVLSPKVQNTGLLARLDFAPNPFTPNGDGVNDEIGVHYSLLSLSVPRPVEITIFDLAGRQVRSLFRGDELSGRYIDKGWDGRDDNGGLVAPGVYLLKITAKGDGGSDQRMRSIAVVY